MRLPKSRAARKASGTSMRSWLESGLGLTLAPISKTARFVPMATWIWISWVSIVSVMIHAASAATHKVTVNLYINLLLTFRRKTTAILVMKNLFDMQSEEPGGAEGER